VEELLVPGSAGTEHQGEFSVDRQVVGIDQPQHGSLDGSLSLHVMCCEHTEPTGNVFEVLIVCSGISDIVTGQAGPFVPVVGSKARTSVRTCKGRVQIQGI